MTCHEIEALKLGLMNVLGTTDESARQHAYAELEGALEGPIEALAEAEDLSAVQRHLDAALVDLEETVATTEKATLSMITSADDSLLSAMPNSQFNDSVCRESQCLMGLLRRMTYCMRLSQSTNDVMLNYLRPLR
jgi:Protein of unknown function (DUF3209).